VNAVEVRGLSKNYPLSSSQWGRLRRVFGSAKHAPKDGLWALRDVSFSVNRGEAFGIIGANGSGKSTLLQIVAGILRPTSGSVEVHGRLSALLELGAGFSPEFTGRDNVYLNGSLLGLTRQEIDGRFAEIERFAGIGDFIGQPIRTYSTGMVLRLAFAVAAHVDPEILIVDEALAVGDIAFRQRCMRKIHDLRAQGTTILFVSHETTDVKALCERCLWLRNGVVQELGESDDVVAKYLSATLRRETGQEEIGHKEIDYLDNPGNPGFESVPGGHRFGDGRAAITGASLVNQSGQSARFIKPLESLVLRIGFRVNAPLASPIAGFLVRNQRGENIFGSNTARENYPLLPMSPGDAVNVDFHCAIPELAPGTYRTSIAVCDGNVEDYQVCDYLEDAIEFNAKSGARASKGYFHLPCATVTAHRNQRCK
jgi:ABC-type polysaccharide/polyol phosphate transport system ATPase subunit